MTDKIVIQVNRPSASAVATISENAGNIETVASSIGQVRAVGDDLSGVNHIAIVSADLAGPNNIGQVVAMEDDIAAVAELAISGGLDITASVASAQAAQTAAETAETAAETARDAAQLAETAAETAQTGAETAEAGAEAARDAAVLGAPGVYADTTTGLAGTSSGEYFSVPSGDANESLLLYLNDTGSASLIKTYPSKAGVTEIVQGYLEPLPQNRFPADIDYSASLDMRASSSIVVTPAGDLADRGYSESVQWRAGNDFARWSSGSDQNGVYVFGAFLLFSENAANLTPTGPTAYSEASGGGLTGLASQVVGQVVLSSTCKLLWVTGQVDNSGDENILIGTNITPADTTRYASGFTLYTASTAFDAEAMVRGILLRDQVRKDANNRAVDQLLDIVKYDAYTNMLPYGDYYGGAPETRTASPVKALPVGALRDLGYRRGIDFGDRSGGSNNFWRYEHGADLSGKSCVGMFLCWAADGLEVPLTASSFFETTGGSLGNAATSTNGSVDLGNNVHLVWLRAQINTSGYENFLIGAIASPTDVYCTGVYVNVADDPQKIDQIISAYTYRQNIMADVLDRLPDGTSAGSATLVLNGTGDVQSYVESSLSGDTIKRMFTPFPTYAIDTYPVVFNVGDDYVNGVQVRASINDDTPPDRMLGATIGANHGYRLGELTATSHGKAQADQGSIWSSGGTEYLLVQVVDADTILFTERSGNGAPPTGTYTHVSGATNTGDITVSAQSYAQWYPPFENRQIECFVDGEKITDTSGSFTYRESVQFVETYDILDKSEIVTWWEANGDSGNIEPDGDPSVRITLTYEFDCDAQLTIYRDWLFLKSTAVNDIMGIQSGRASGTTHYYIPNTIEFTHDGDTVNYSLIEEADRTSTGGQVSVNFSPSEAEATGPFVDRVLSLFGSDYVFAQGFLPLGSFSDDTVRRTLCSVKGLEIRGNTDKLYMHTVDKGDFTAAAGEYYSAVAYRHIFPRPTERTAAYPVRTRGADYLYIDWHDVAKVDRVPVPSDFAGRDFEVVASRNVTLYSDVLTGHINVNVAASGDYGFLVLKISK